MECKELDGCVKININCCDKGDGSTGSGADGKSAYEIAVENGFDGTEQDWLDSLAGGNGYNGWTPVLANVADVDRIVQQVIEWTGGTGEKLKTGLYVGTNGLVSSIAQATDIRGKMGATGEQGPKGDNGAGYGQLTGVMGTLERKALTANAWTKVKFIPTDGDITYINASGEFVAQKAGVYNFYSEYGVVSANGTTSAWYQYNAPTTYNLSTSKGLGNHMCILFPPAILKLYLNAGDNISFWVSSSVAQAINSNPSSFIITYDGKFV